ncbi:hypothetical protein DFH07DRAFT_974716 [Mycena maculata]|uniref:Uncharacterized protein n=1 Tax=Mycena maculata TaxID=230809 RepID=A0AAD7H711_9AGAR|nr:hypothetical protein DFH07DRAFT_974716 [Mycena maculata]
MVFVRSGKTANLPGFLEIAVESHRATTNPLHEVLGIPGTLSRLNHLEISDNVGRDFGPLLDMIELAVVVHHRFFTTTVCLIGIQATQLENENKELAEQLHIVAKWVDYIEHVYRKEERLLLVLDYDQLETDRTIEAEEDAAGTARGTERRAIEEEERMERERTTEERSVNPSPKRSGCLRQDRQGRGGGNAARLHKKERAERSKAAPAQGRGVVGSLHYAGSHAVRTDTSRIRNHQHFAHDTAPDLRMSVNAGDGCVPSAAVGYGVGFNPAPSVGYG